MFSQGGGGGVNLTSSPLQISAAEGPISIKIGTDIDKHVKSIAAYFFLQKHFTLLNWYYNLCKQYA